MFNKKEFFLFFVLVFFSASTLWAGEKELNWGGPGYDPVLKQYAQTSRYLARFYANTKAVIVIFVDSQEAQQGVSQMKLTDDHNRSVSSTECWKSMRHSSAPTACSFKKIDLNKFSGTGTIEILSATNNAVLEKSSIDLDQLLHLQ